MTNTEYTELLRAASVGTRGLATFLPGVGSVVGRIIAEGLGLAADFAATGADPVAEIRRIRETDVLLATVEREWEGEMGRKFGP